MSIDFNALALAPCITAFGDIVTYQPGAGPPVSLRGIFNRYATEDKISDTGDMRQVVAPTLAINIDDLTPSAPLPCKGEAVIVDGVYYEITEPVLDNFGQLMLRLKRAQ